jgi:very-short-patch-repair endonuclease
VRNHEANELANAVAREARAWRVSDLERRWSPASVRAALRADVVTRVAPGIVAASIHADSFAARAHAAHLMCGDGSVVVGQGAASVWNLCDTPQTVIVSVPYGMKRACPPWLELRRLACEIPTAWWGPVPIAMPAWAAVTGFAFTSTAERDAFLYGVIQSRKATPAELLEVAAHMPRLRGRRHLEAVVSAAQAGAESHLERVGLRSVFNTSDFADFLRQHWVRTPGGNYRLDMYHPASKTAVELDGAGGHGKPERRQYDITRDANVARIGVLTVRLSSADVFTRPIWCREAVADVVASRL